MANFRAIYWNLSERVSGKQSFLNLSIFFSFLFCRNVPEFILGRISAVNFRLILLLFLRKLLACSSLPEIQEARDETQIIFLPFISVPKLILFFYFGFISWEALFKKQVTKPICWLNFPAFSSVPEFVQRFQ